MQNQKKITKKPTVNLLQSRHPTTRLFRLFARKMSLFWRFWILIWSLNSKFTFSKGLPLETRFLHESRTVNIEWKRAVFLNDSMHLTSAFMVPQKKHKGHALKILAVGTDGAALASQSLACWICQNRFITINSCFKSFVTSSQFDTSPKSHHGKPWIVIVVNCPISASQKAASWVTLGSSFASIQHSKAWVPIKQIGTINPRYKLSMCSGPLFTKDRSEPDAYHGFHQSLAAVLPEWFEYYQGMGVQHFKMYMMPSLDQRTRSVLGYYAHLGIVEILEWNATHQTFDSIWAHGQMAFSHDCLYRSLGVADWVLVTDVDEYLTVDGHESFQSAIPEMNNPKIGFIQFSSWFYDRTCPLVVRKKHPFLLTDQVRIRASSPEKYRQKWMARPMAVPSPGIHGTGKIVKGFRKKYIMHDRGIFVKHFSAYIPTPKCTIKHDKRSFDSTLQNITALSSRVEKVVQDLRKEYRYGQDPFQEIIPLKGYVLH